MCGNGIASSGFDRRHGLGVSVVVVVVVEEWKEEEGEEEEEGGWLA